MFQKKTVTIGTIGAGYAAGLHASGFQRVCGLEIRLKTICDVRLDAAEKVKDLFGYEQAISDYEEMLFRFRKIDVIEYRDSSVSPLYKWLFKRSKQGSM